MKLFAQYGHADGQKVRTALEANIIDGVIYSPKDISSEKIVTTLNDVAARFPTAERLFDPQFYATLVANAPNSRCGSLMIDYADYFQPRRRTQLESESKVVEDLAASLAYQSSLNLTSVIAPGILIPNSLNSIESVIAKNFIRHAKPAANSAGITCPVLATLAISCEALRNHDELIELLADITALDTPPDGFYILVSTIAGDGRVDIFNRNTVAGWLLLNHTLNLNGLRVVNGYSDIMTPFLGAAGGDAGATGWWSNLRAFSLNRFAPDTSGGRLPIQRYLSCALLNRITFDELERLRTNVPSILNGLPSDDLYPTEDGSEPNRPMEVLQSWEALKELNEQLASDTDVSENLEASHQKIDAAVDTYADVQAALFSPLDHKSDSSHLGPLNDGLDLFAELAELGSS